jgi:hypothetical protein
MRGSLLLQAPRLIRGYLGSPQTRLSLYGQGNAIGVGIIGGMGDPQPHSLGALI